jgi:hypothetical protein
MSRASGRSSKQVTIFFLGFTTQQLFWFRFSSSGTAGTAPPWNTTTERRTAIRRPSTSRTTVVQCCTAPVVTMLQAASSPHTTLTVLTSSSATGPATMTAGSCRPNTNCPTLITTEPNTSSDSTMWVHKIQDKSFSFCTVLNSSYSYSHICYNGCILWSIKKYRLKVLIPTASCHANLSLKMLSVCHKLEHKSCEFVQTAR